jgi:hypothetical protein
LFGRRFKPVYELHHRPGWTLLIFLLYTDDVNAQTKTRVIETNVAAQKNHNT